MKRERTISDLFDTLNINEDKRQKLCTTIVHVNTHNDIFNIGEINLTKHIYTKNEVIQIINNHETNLYKKFKSFIQTNLYSIFNPLSIFPNWVK